MPREMGGAESDIEHPETAKKQKGKELARAVIVDGKAHEEALPR